MRHTPPKPLCWLIVILLLFEWSGVIAWPPSGQAAQPVSLALPSAAELAKAGSTLQIPSPSAVSPDDFVARADALVRSIPRVRYDLAARAQALGSGVDPAFRFVRDQIRFEAYPGVLRGAEGTYVTRAGNAFDRALLLADLLKRKGLKTRFALGKLPRPQAERLFARIFEPTPPLEADAVSKAPAPGQPEAEAFMTRLRARAVRDYAAIRKALGNALPSKAGPSREEVLREIEAHVWVQAEVNGRWVDLDSALPDAAPGRTYPAAARTVESLPKESYQRVTIRVTSETLTGGSLKTEAALEFSAPAEELLDRQVFLVHTPAGGGGGLGGGISGAVAGADAWTPMLWVDGQFHVGKPISFADKKPAERGRPPGGGLGGLFGAGGALSSSSQFVAEWLEFEIVFPDGRREVTRRALVDRAGMVWRQASKLDASTLRPLPRDADGLLAPRALHNIWLSAGRHNLAGYGDALHLFTRWMRDLAKDSASAPEKTGATSASTPEPTFGEQVWPFAMMNFAFLVRSDHAVVPALNDSPSIRLYADSPRILTVSIGPMAGAAAASAYLEGDLRRDHLRALAREPSAEAGAVERKIWFGVLQGALEHETGVQYAVAGGADSAAVSSTSGLLTSEGLVALRPGTALVGPLAANPETVARTADALARGSVLVVPRPVLRGGFSVGWWEINSHGADTRAVMTGDLNVFCIPICLPPVGGGGSPVPGVPPAEPPFPGPGPIHPGPPRIPPPPWPTPRPLPRVDQPKFRLPRAPLPRRPPLPPMTRTPSPDYLWPGGTKTEECAKKGGSLSIPGIRVAMAAPVSSSLLDGQPGESVRPPVLLAQTATESTLVTKCVAVPAVGVAGIAMAIVAVGFLGVAAAALGYLIGSNL